MSNQLLIVDTETTSVNPQDANILEIALATVDLDSGQIDFVVDTLVCPECREEVWLNSWFMSHSGLDPDLIRSAPTFSSIRREIQEHVSQLPTTAYNLYYDAGVLYYHQVNLPIRAPCLMLTCADVLKSTGYGKYKWPKFSEAWAYFFPNDDFKEEHRADYDVLHEAELAVVLYKLGYLM